MAVRGHLPVTRKPLYSFSALLVAGASVIGIAWWTQRLAAVATPEEFRKTEALLALIVWHRCMFNESGAFMPL